jgi:hypothetical protein
MRSRERRRAVKLARPPINVTIPGPRFQTDERQVTEGAIAADALNRLLDLGHPSYVRIA